MFNDFFHTANTMHHGDEPFAIALVVRRKNPTSGKPGDKAVITRDGKIRGWIGGGCTKGIVLKEALAAIRDGRPRLVSINSETRHMQKENTKHYDMTCLSKGEVEVYIEPVLPKTHLVIVGKSHIAMALCRLSKAMGYTTTLVADGVDKEAYPEADHFVTLDAFDSGRIAENSCIVVSTQGDGDETALLKSLQSSAGYIAFVASRIKANALFRQLKESGISFEDLKRIKTPAGLDINAKLPQEVAISILAEIIQHIRSQPQEEESAKEESVPEVPPGYYLNPVCNIPIEIATAKHIVEYGEEKVYFCCDGCKVSFDKDPEKYMKPAMQ
jgi:xanthine dehydrogenase accessory factor